MSRGNTLTYELSRMNPEAFKASAVASLGKYSVFGANVWHYPYSLGEQSPARLQLDTTSWQSRNDAAGSITLGTQPMGDALKDHLFFDGDSFDYAHEISYRLLHERAHSFLYFIQDTPSGTALIRAVENIREKTSGRLGLSALGSLDHYQGQQKVAEDATELITMHAWNPRYASDFMQFLADPDYSAVRREAGLVSLGSPEVLTGIVARAVEENLPL